MSKFVVVGAGPVGRETAKLLEEVGHEVVLTSRSVAQAGLGSVRCVQADATDAPALAEISKGADAIFMCAMAPYDRWPTEFFPIMDGITRAAELTNSRLIVLGNVYGYGANDPKPIQSDAPLNPSTRKGTVRTIMWQRALRATVPALEIRSSDFLGQGAITYFSLLALPSLLEGAPVTFLGDVDADHAWSFTKDVARTLVAASGYKGEWNRAFHVPSAQASPRLVMEKCATLLGKPLGPIDTYTLEQQSQYGMQELIEMNYLFQTPLLIDASDTETLLGVKAQSLDVMIKDTLEGHL